jgi:hypothetical protein
MKPIQGCHLIKPDDLHWRTSNLMKIPNADYLDRTGSESIGAPEELEFLPGAKARPDMSLIYPVAPTQLPKELAGTQWPPKG